MTLREKQWLFLQCVSELIRDVNALQFPSVVLTAGELWRSDPEQKRLYDAKLSKVIHSDHQNRTAVDFNIFVDGVWLTSAPYGGSEEFVAVMRMGKYWESLCSDRELIPDWGGRYGVPLDVQVDVIGWDFGHFGVRV